MRKRAGWRRSVRQQHVPQVDRLPNVPHIAGGISGIGGPVAHLPGLGDLRFEPMLVTLYEMETDNKGSSYPVRSTQVETDTYTSVPGLLEQGGFFEHEFFSLATSACDADDRTFGEERTLIVLFGLDEERRIHFHQHDQPLPWDYFVRAVERGFYTGDPAHLAVFRGAAGGPQPEYLQQLVDFLLSPVPAALAGALAARLVHPLELIDKLKARRRRALGKELRRRGLTGPRLRAVLLEYPQWDSTDLADGFGWTKPEALRALLNAGYQLDDDDLWRISSTDAGQTQRQEMDDLAQRASDDMDL